MSTPTPATTKYTTEQIYELAAAGQFIPPEFVNIPSNDDGRPALFIAAERGNIPAVRALLKAGANPHATDNQGSTALHTAAYFGSTDLIQILLNAGCQLNVQNRSQNTPLHIATKYRRVAAVQQLLAAGAKPEARDEEGETPLHDAARQGQLEIIQALLAAGAEINVRNQKGNTPLHDTIEYGRIETVQPLLTAGANPDATNDKRETPLHIAIRYRWAAAAQQLLAAGANPNAKDNQETTPLHDAARQGQLEIIQALLAAGAEINAQNQEGNTPLHEAAYFGKVASIEQLVAAGADPHLKNNAGETPLDTAAISIKFLAIDALPALLAVGVGLWEGRLVTLRAEDTGLSSKIRAELNALEKSMLDEPVAHQYLNFKGFPQDRRDELETCLEKLATHYKTHPEEEKTLKGLCLDGVSLTPKGEKALAEIIEKGNLTHLSLANTNCVVTNQSLIGQAIISNSSIKTLNLSNPLINPRVLGVVGPLIREGQLNTLALLAANFTEADIADLNSLCNDQLMGRYLPTIYLSDTPAVAEGLAKASYNLQQAAQLVMDNGALRPQRPSLEMLATDQLNTQIKNCLAQTFLAPPKEQPQAALEDTGAGVDAEHQGRPAAPVQQTQIGSEIQRVVSTEEPPTPGCLERLLGSCFPSRYGRL